MDSKIIIGSVREALNVTDWLVAGADIVTIPPEFMKIMLVHPFSKETVAMFLNDAEKL